MHKLADKPALQGKKVLLRPIQEADIPVMLEILQEEQVQWLTGSVTTRNEAKTAFSEYRKAQIVQWYQTRNQQTDRLDLVIVTTHDHQVIGEIVFNEVDAVAKKANIRLLISEKAVNRGYGSEALHLFLTYGFSKLELNKVELAVHSSNPRAEHVYQKAGFRLEGILREDIVYESSYYDTKLYGLLNREYQNAAINSNRECPTP